MTVSVFLRKPRCLNFHEDSSVHRKYLIIIRLLSNVVGTNCQWTVTAKMLNLCTHTNKSWQVKVISGCSQVHSYGSCRKVSWNHNQNILIGELVHLLILILPYLCGCMCIYIHFSQLSRPRRLNLSPQKLLRHQWSKTPNSISTSN